MTAKKKEKFQKVKIELIDRPDEIVRLDIDDDELQELANSIQERGLIQPIGVTPRGERFMVVFGDRRFLAHKLLEKKDIMCRIEDIDDNQVAIDRAMENIQRVNLSAFEEGHIFKGLYERAGMNLDEISKAVGKSPGVVQRRMDIMRMPESFQKALHAAKISISVAEQLWSCPDEAKREYFLEMAVEHGITFRVARQWVDDFRKELRARTPGADPGRGEMSPFETVPIYRACDLCRAPVDYAKLKELRICPGCHGQIVEAFNKTE